MDCLFCKINAKEIDSDIIYEDDEILVFSDIAPKAPIHKLIIPKKHISTINDLEAEDQPLVGKMIFTAKKVAQQLQIDENGYRLVYNVGQGGGQVIYHIHLHLLGGRNLEWPPG